MSEQHGDSISGTISGNVSGQVAIGKGIRQTQSVVSGPAAGAVSDAELADLQRAFAELQASVAAQAPPETKEAALERIGELQAAVTAKEPDLTTIEYVKRWFLTKLPALAGMVTGVLVHPTVGRLVTAAGDLVADEFRRRIAPDAGQTAGPAS